MTETYATFDDAMRGARARNRSRKRHRPIGIYMVANVPTPYFLIRNVSGVYDGPTPTVPEQCAIIVMVGLLVRYYSYTYFSEDAANDTATTTKAEVEE